VNALANRSKPSGYRVALKMYILMHDELAAGSRRFVIAGVRFLVHHNSPRCSFCPGFGDCQLRKFR
jgi:hypothetical protein